ESPTGDLNSCDPNAPVPTTRPAPEVQPNPAATHAPVSGVARKDTTTTASQSVRRPVLPSQRLPGPIDLLLPVPGSVGPAQTVRGPLSDPPSGPRSEPLSDSVSPTVPSAAQRVLSWPPVVDLPAKGEGATLPFPLTGLGLLVLGVGVLLLRRRSP